MTNTAAFQTTGTASYMVEPVTPELAEYVGCPGADFRLVGRETVYGSFMATGRVPGREVAVPAWYRRKGVRVLFVPAVLDDTVDWGQPVDGYLALD